MYEKQATGCKVCMTPGGTGIPLCLLFVTSFCTHVVDLFSKGDILFRVLVIADPTFRLLVYERHLLRRPITEDDRTADGTRRRLSISPSFFTRREGEQRPRISLFVRRELAVLMQVRLLPVFIISTAD